MILYFTGTRNSRYIARRLAEQLKDEAVSIGQRMKEGAPGTFLSQTPFVIVSPVYMSRMPQEVEEFLRHSRFMGNNAVYFVLTAGASVGNAESCCRKLCGEMGLNYQGTAAVAMPANYMALYDVIPKEEAKTAAAERLPLIDAIAQTIADGQALTPDPSLTGIKASTAIAPLFHRLMVKDRAFTVNDDCTRCGTCADLCPRNNIRLENGSPVWTGNCMHCMACISACPVRAIDYGRRTKKRQRYYLP